MPEYYYQIKGKEGGDPAYSFSNWAFPPVFSDKVKASNKKEARLLIEDTKSIHKPTPTVEEG